MSNKIEEILRELHERFLGLYGQRLVRIVLFGSEARGQTDAESDVDVLVVLQGPVYPGQEIFRTGGVVSELSLRADRTISCVFVDEEEFHHGQGPLLLNVRREGVGIS